MIVRALFALVASCALCSCISPSTIESHALVHDPDDRGYSERQCRWNDDFFAGYESGAHACNGLVYTLPRAIIKVSFERTVVTWSTMKASRDATAKDVEDLGKLIATLNAQLKQFGCAPNATLDPCKSLQAQLAAAKSQEPVAKAAAAAAAAQFDAWPSGTFKDSITLTALPFQPDPQFRFFARLDHSWIRNDQWTLGTSRDGFLTSSKSQPQDTTATLLVAIANLATTVAQIPALRTNELALQAILPERAPKPTCTPHGPLSREYILDVAHMARDGKVPSHYLSPLDDASSAGSINAALEHMCSPLRVGVRRLWQRQAGYRQPAAESEAGLVYRRPLPYEIVIFQKEGEAGTSVDSIKRLTVMLPNEAPLEVVSYPSAALSTVTQSVAFENGFPTQMDFNRPGEAVSFVKLPLDILQAIFAIPAAAFTSPAPTPPATTGTSGTTTTAPAGTPAAPGSATPTSF